MRGRIVRRPKGQNFAFLKGDTEPFERFYHGRAVSLDSSVSFDELEVTDIVEFDPETEAGRYRATNVRLVAKDNGDTAPPLEPEEER